MKTVLSFIALLGIMVLVSCGFEDINQGPTFQEQLAVDVGLIDAYLAENQITAEIDGSGIRYVHDVIGQGESPVFGDLIVMKFKSKLLDETSFIQDTIGLTVRLNDPTIKVLQIIIPLMNVGGRATIYTPSGYCFGNNIVGGAPANSNVIFEVELLAIIKNADEQLIADQNIIDEFLVESQLIAETHSSGIRFITLVEGTGNSPIATDQVVTKYKGTYMNGQLFDQNTTGVQFSLPNLIEAWRIMIPTMKVGGKIEIYAPSKYCYGPGGNSSIPPNTILVFEIELVSIN